MHTGGHSLRVQEDLLQPMDCIVFILLCCESQIIWGYSDITELNDGCSKSHYLALKLTTMWELHFQMSWLAIATSHITRQPLDLNVPFDEETEHSRILHSLEFQSMLPFGFIWSLKRNWQFQWICTYMDWYMRQCSMAHFWGLFVAQSGHTLDHS